ncbi:hypothetical protein ACWGLE_26705, partial [Streptomyces sp. NPDC055897]
AVGCVGVGGRGVAAVGDRGQGVARNHRDAAVVADLLVTAVERLFRTGGLHARDGEGTLQRCWRDVHTVASHAVLQFEEAAAHYAGAALTP